jgi:hypothetical protein
MFSSLSPSTSIPPSPSFLLGLCLCCYQMGIVVWQHSGVHQHFWAITDLSLPCCTLPFPMLISLSIYNSLLPIFSSYSSRPSSSKIIIAPAPIHALIPSFSQPRHCSIPFGQCARSEIEDECSSSQPALGTCSWLLRHPPSFGWCWSVGQAIGPSILQCEMDQGLFVFCCYRPILSRCRCPSPWCWTHSCHRKPCFLDMMLTSYHPYTLLDLRKLSSAWPKPTGFWPTHEP